MAQVTMDINELDALREERRKCEERIRDFSIELEKVLADKRVVIKTVTRDTFEKPSLEELRSLISSYYNAARRGSSGKLEDILDYIFNRIQISFYSKKGSESIEYINFDDVQSSLRIEIEAKVSNELGRLKSQVSQYEEKIGHLHSDHQSEIQKNEHEYKAILKTKDDEIEKQKRMYNDLKNDRDTRSTEQRLREDIVKLETSLLKERRKTWWQKLWERKSQ